jgi:hypothetical protein
MIYMCCILILASDVKVCIPESLLVSKCSPTHNAFVPHICTAHHWSSWFFAYRKVLHESPYICRVVDCSHMYLIFFLFFFSMNCRWNDWLLIWTKYPTMIWSSDIVWTQWGSWTTYRNRGMPYVYYYKGKWNSGHILYRVCYSLLQTIYLYSNGHKVTVAMGKVPHADITSLQWPPTVETGRPQPVATVQNYSNGEADISMPVSTNRFSK